MEQAPEEAMFVDLSRNGTRALFVENYNEEHSAASALWFCTSVLNLKIDISEDVGRFSAVESNHLRDS